MGTPTPTPTRTPTITPTPTPPPECQLGDPCAYIHASKTVVEVDEKIDLNLSIVNSPNQPTMNAQLLLMIPSGMTLTQHDVVDACTGQCHTNYRVEPGENKNIKMSLNPNQPGEFNISGKVEWSFQGEGDALVEGKIIDLNIDVVHASEKSVEIPAQTTSPPSGSCNSRGNSTDSETPVSLMLFFLPLLFATGTRKYSWEKILDQKNKSDIYTQ